MPKESKAMAQMRARKRNRLLGLVGAVAVVVLVVAALAIFTPPSTSKLCPVDNPADRCAVITTASGVIVFEFEEGKMPISCSHFIAVMQTGYYNGLIWHRVEGFVIQTGQGAQWSTVQHETNNGVSNIRGAVGVARTTDLDSGTTQFYILKQDSVSLDTANGGYSIFGMVKVGMNIVDHVALNETISRIEVVSAFPA